MDQQSTATEEKGLDSYQSKKAGENASLQIKREASRLIKQKSWKSRSAQIRKQSN